jgi:hypothetical protein
MTEAAPGWHDRQARVTPCGAWKLRVITGVWSKCGRMRRLKPAAGSAAARPEDRRATKAAAVATRSTSSAAGAPRFLIQVNMVLAR